MSCEETSHAEGPELLHGAILLHTAQRQIKARGLLNSVHVTETKWRTRTAITFFSLACPRSDESVGSIVMSRRPFGDSKGLDDVPDKSLYDPFNLPSSTARPGPRHGRSSSPGLLGKFGLAQPSLHMYVLVEARSPAAPCCLLCPYR